MNPEASGKIVTVAVIGMIYFFPTMIAYQCDLAKRQSIVALNLFFGWTVIDWVDALARTMCKPARI